MDTVLSKDCKENKLKSRRLAMRKRRHITRFTPEQVIELSKNPCTKYVTPCNISYTLEFKNLFLSHYEAGERAKDIFLELGYDPNVLGDSRIYCFAYELLNRIEKGEPLTETPYIRSVEKPANVDYNTLPSQQSIAAMQRELTYLRQQVEFLKKISQLDTKKKPEK